jgi:predicted permease
MGWMRRLRNTVFASDIDETFAHETRAHLAERVDLYVRRGMTHEEAEEKARRRMGNLTLAREQTRDADTLPWLDDLGRDIRYAVRTLRRTPGFTAIAVLTLALGIGANTAMFSVVYGILLRPFPYGASDRLLLVQRERDLNGAHRPVSAFFNSPADLDGWRQGLKSFDSIAVYSAEVAALSTSDGNDVINTSIVSDTFFSTLAGRIAAGRPIGAVDDLTPSVVISERLARRLFGNIQSAVGRYVTLSSRTYAVVGISDSSLQFPSPKTDAWMPAGFMKTVSPTCCGFRMFGRLKPGATIEQATAEAVVAANALGPTVFGPRANLRATIVSLRDQVVGSVRPALFMLFAAVGLLLLVACANLVNLLLARQMARAREIATRRALGASRARLVMQFMAEVSVLAGAGVSVGIAIAIESVRLLKRWQPPGLPRLDAVHVDIPVLLFSIAVGLLAAIGAATIPAFRSGRDISAATFGGSRMTGATRRIRHVICASELAVSLVLLIGASLLGRSLVRLMGTDIGVTTDHVVTASLNMAFGGRPSDAQAVERIGRVLQRIEAVPGVTTAGVGSALPPNASRLTLTLRRDGDSVDYLAAGVAATPDYFHALGMRLISGRLFTVQDDLDHPPVMIMNLDTARRFFGQDNPVGRTMSLPVSRNGKNGREDMTLVGVVSNVKYSGLDAAADDAVYRPFKQQTAPAPFLVVRTAVDPQMLIPALRREINIADRSMVVADVRPLDAIVLDAAAQPRFRSALLAVIALLALAMAVVGLYGVVAYSVAQRSQEIGVRMALGARERDVLQMVLGEGALMACAGIAGGIAISLAATRSLAGLLYGVAATDLGSYAAAAASLFVVAAIASYVPARRAMKIDPVVALRHE